MPDSKTPAGPAGPRLTALLKPYAPLIVMIVVLTIAANSLNLIVPKLIARAIDTFATRQLVVGTLVLEFLAVAIGIFFFTYLQYIAQTYASERVARDLRTTLVAKLATQDLAYIQRTTTARLLTNLTSDIDAVKLFVSQAVGALVSSVFLILGASVLLLAINWRLGLAVLAVLPVIGVTFKVVLGRVRTLFTRSQQAIDWLNKVINESILGAALIRLLNSQHYEYDKFLAANTEARDISLSILRLFAGLIPIIIFSTNLATLMILTLGGHFVIVGAMSLGDFTAFNGYLAILIFPVLLIGFMSNVMAQASASYARIASVLVAPAPKESGRTIADLRGDITLSHVIVKFGEKAIATAELKEFIGALPQGLDTVVSERGTSLSGGQKQRIMLARALALNPRVLLLDDFTARVDATTERKILENVRRNYPGLTLLSVTQKIAPIEDYDQIVLLMEGEVLASGTHHDLLATCPEYVQIHDSQRSTHHYESVQA